MQLSLFFIGVTDDLARAVKGADIVLLAVGTPMRRGDGHADLSYVYGAVEDTSLEDSRNVGLAWKADNSKSVRELGMTYRPLAQTMNDFFAYMISSGAFAR